VLVRLRLDLARDELAQRVAQQRVLGRRGEEVEGGIERSAHGGSSEVGPKYRLRAAARVARRSPIAQPFSMVGAMPSGFEWAGFLVTRRAAIDRALAARLGGVLPPPGAAESEALRRFRSFAGARLRRADDAAPALDGLRVDPFETARLVDAWCDGAAEIAGARGAELDALLAPLRERFRTALLGTESAHQARRAPRPGRRAVAAAIDRIADPFFAVDLDDGAIADANPAAATLLGVAREALLGAKALGCVAAESRERWSAELDALVESAAPRRFPARFTSASGASIAADVHATRLATKDRVLAIVVARLV